MRRIAIAVLLFAVVPARGEEPSLVVDRAIKAIGGESAVAKTRAMTMTAKGKVNFNGADVDAQWVSKWNLPDQVYFEVTLQSGPNRSRNAIVLDGPRGWQALDGKGTGSLAPTHYAAVSDEAHVFWLSRLDALKKKSVKLAALPDQPVDDQPAHVLKVTHEGRPDVQLFFSQASGLPVKASCRKSGSEVLMELQFGDPKDFAGVRLPTKLTHSENGVRMGLWTVGDYQFVDKHDPATFKKPG